MGGARGHPAVPAHATPATRESRGMQKSRCIVEKLLAFEGMGDGMCNGGGGRH